MYGGRAIDSFDRRILTTYMDEYLGDFIFDTFQPFHFFRNKEVDYKIPAGDVKEKFVGEIPRRSGSGWKAVSEGDCRRRDSSPCLSATPLGAQPRVRAGRVGSALLSWDTGRHLRPCPEGQSGARDAH